MPDARRELPSIHQLADLVEAQVASRSSRKAITAAARLVIAAARAIPNGSVTPERELVERTVSQLEGSSEPSLRPVINATGVILQTNLGRAPLSDRALRAMAEVGAGYSNLEFDVAQGSRGSRHEHVRELIRATTGAEDGMVVNNNAAAVFMVLAVFAAGHEVLVSRGEAVEIGGGFRIPDVLAQSGARLVEVGTTNRTYAHDYGRAWTPDTAAILRVHPSNFRVAGFTARPELAQLVEVAHTSGGLLLDDLGSGALVDTARYGIAHEPTAQEAVAGGADLVMFSGDKLLGGPQCGVVAGRADLVARLRAHPLARALRVDKLTIAALNATLASYTDGSAEAEVPLLRMLAAPLPELRRRAGRWARAAGTVGSLRRERSMVGGGSLPGESLPTWCAAFATAAPNALAARLRQHKPPIIARVHDGVVLLDPRTVDRRDDTVVGAAVRVLTPTGRQATVDPREDRVL